MKVLGALLSLPFLVSQSIYASDISGFSSSYSPTVSKSVTLEGKANLHSISMDKDGGVKVQFEVKGRKLGFLLTADGEAAKSFKEILSQIDFEVSVDEITTSGLFGSNTKYVLKESTIPHLEE